MRLQKFMALCGVASRRKCEEIIKEGRVYVNGQSIQDMGVKIDPCRDKVIVDDKPLDLEENNIYILLNKPRGTISSVSDQFDRTTVIDHVDLKESRIYPVGRLDYDTEGLIILTNDGDFAYQMTHPKHQIEKEYFCIVNGVPEANKLDKLRVGIDIGGFVTSPAIVKNIKPEKNNTSLQIIIKEGKNRQVRRMFETIGHPVVFLKRTRIGSIKLGSLNAGEWRYLTREEIGRLKIF